MVRTSVATGLLALLLLLPPILSDLGADDGHTADRYAQWIVVVPEVDRELADRLASRVEVLQLDAGGRTATVLVDAVGLEWVHSLRPSAAIDSDLTASFHKARAPLPGQEAGIDGLPCYRTVDEIVADAASLVASYPGIAESVDIGDSWEKTQNPLEGDDVLLLRLTNRSIPGPKPTLLVNASMHAREVVGGEVALRFAEGLASAYDVDPDVTWLLDRQEVHVVAVLNPDGHRKVEAGTDWRKNTNDTSGGACDPDDVGIDLNRNFPFEWANWGGSSTDPCAETYHGPAAVSEPETQALVDRVRSTFADRRPDDLSTPAPSDTSGLLVDLQSYGEQILTSWGFTTDPPPNADGILRLAEKLSYFSEYEAVPGSIGAVDGAIKDFVYGELGVPGLTVEIGGWFYQQCPNFEALTKGESLRMLEYAARAAAGPYQLPRGPETLDLTVSPQVVTPGGIVEVRSRVDDSRFGPNHGQTIHNVAAAEATVDLPPGTVGAVPVPGTSVDGLFDSPAEQVVATTDTDGLAQGRHIAFVRGQDAGGSWGPPTAAFFWVLDPTTSAKMSGTVRDADTAAPIAAVVRAGLFLTESDPVTGDYHLVVEDGTYDVVFEAEGFGARTATGVAAAGPTTVVLDMALAPVQTVLADDGEGTDPGWTAEGTWSRTSSDANSPTHSWTDSPGGSVVPGQDAALVSPVLDLSGLSDVRLELWHRLALEKHFNYTSIEMSTDGGSSWSPIRYFAGDVPSWSPLRLDLPALDGASQARFRFRVVISPGAGTIDGWYIDDILLTGAPPIDVSYVFADGFESGDTTLWSATTAP